MNSNLNILAIIRSAFDPASLHLFLERGQKIGFKYE